MYSVRPPYLTQKIYKRLTWNIPTNDKIIYLTFDDGPTPEVTPWVLDTLKKFNAKATFFCIGKNVKKHPEIFKQIIEDDHAVGNHTFNHLNGWKTKKEDYLNEDVLQRNFQSGRLERQKSPLDIDFFDLTEKWLNPAPKTTVIENPN